MLTHFARTAASGSSLALPSGAAALPPRRGRHFFVERLPGRLEFSRLGGLGRRKVPLFRDILGQIEQLPAGFPASFVELPITRSERGLRSDPPVMLRANCGLVASAARQMREQ